MIKVSLPGANEDPVLKVSLPGASNATTVVRVPAEDDIVQVRDRVEGALRGILSGGAVHSPQGPFTYDVRNI